MLHCAGCDETDVVGSRLYDVRVWYAVDMTVRTETVAYCADCAELMVMGWNPDIVAWRMHGAEDGSWGVPRRSLEAMKNVL